MLNFSTGPAAAQSACKAAEIKLVVTARKFVEKAKLEAMVAALASQTTVLYLEDVRGEIGITTRIRALVRSLMARPRHRRERAHDPAVVLFTSGSEGTPKGVVLSHRNLLANRHQLGSVVDFSPKDIVFNALPVFHSFGLTGGLLLPLLAGVRVFLYPSPLHYRTVPELAYGVNATILFGTDTFLAGYARVADNYDFYSVRYVFAGAERVKPETRRVWSEKFGIRILEGYGATETAPALAVNTPMHFKAGTVGRLLPGVEHRLETVEGIADAARLFVSGPNVMLGYLRAENPGVIDPPPDGWYDTGDIVQIDAEGFVTIKGRAKRFAKVAGEMVPLGAVEELVARVWPSAMHAVVSVPDAKGESSSCSSPIKRMPLAPRWPAPRAKPGFRRSSCRARSRTLQRCRSWERGRSTTSALESSQSSWRRLPRSGRPRFGPVSLVLCANHVPLPHAALQANVR